MIKSYLSFLVFISIVFISCNKDSDSDPTPAQSTHDIYIGGADNGPVYWKNGVRVGLQHDTAALGASFVSCMFVNGNDVYAAGRHGTQAAYWINGALVLLPVVGSGYSYATGIVIFNGDLYISGYDNFSVGGYNSHAIYWKNGIRIELPDSLGGSYTQDICVYRNDLYIVGGDFGGGATYWINGIQNSISIQQSSAYAIAFNGSDQYISGDSLNYPVYWKNGVKHDIPNIAQYSSPSEIYTNNNNLFFCINENNLPVVLINSSKINLPIDPNLTQGHAIEITSINNDIYVVGYERDGFTPQISNAICWKNGVRNVLPSISGIAAANCIVID